jgi:hypothetical protein
VAEEEAAEVLPGKLESLELITSVVEVAEEEAVAADSWAAILAAQE